VSNFSNNSNSSHLDYYLKHKISPVHYNSGALSKHAEIRESLYQSLGLAPTTLKGVDILEIAPGSGQNSVFAASCMPASLTLVEPNPTGREQIESLYATLSHPHVKPEIVPKMLQDFNPSHRYDIVICENWLGARADEVELIKKLASLVALGGILVITAVPISGFFPNIMRRLLALRIAPEDMEFEKRTSVLVEAFGPHLDTIEHMTRSHRDWVHDCMMNPHYLNVGLPFETINEAIGSSMEVMSTYPRFTNDWRWFKSLSREVRKFNDQLVAAQSGNLCNFLDYRREFPINKLDSDGSIINTINAIHRSALDWENAYNNKENDKATKLSGSITSMLDEIKTSIEPADAEIAQAIAELKDIWQTESLTSKDISDMRHFSHIFGRETVYMSLVKGATDHQF